jgi:hypothetical protein
VARNTAETKTAENPHDARVAIVRHVLQECYTLMSISNELIAQLKMNGVSVRPATDLA